MRRWPPDPSGSSLLLFGGALDYPSGLMGDTWAWESFLARVQAGDRGSGARQAAVRMAANPRPRLRVSLPTIATSPGELSLLCY
jgi:hypothetical protein